MYVEDAIAVTETGAVAVVVSNHGERVLDHTPGTAEVLSEIVELSERHYFYVSKFLFALKPLNKII